MTPTLTGGMPDLPEPADTAYVEGPAMQGGEYRTLSKNYEPDCAMYSPNQVRAIQEAAFNAGRAEGGKDAERLDWLERQSESYGFQDIHEGNRWCVEGAYATLRKLIDAAISQEPKS